MKSPYEKPMVYDLPLSKRVSVRGVLLPQARELFEIVRTNALAGHFVRDWSDARFDSNRIEHDCPMVLWVLPGIPVLHWVARLEPVQREGPGPSGTLRLVGNPSQPGSIQGGLTALANSAHVDLNALGLPDEHGGWTVGGHLGVLVPGEGLLAVRIQGVCRNVRVLWSAISQAHLE